MDRILAAWQPLVPASQRAAFDGMVARSKEFRAFRSETVRLGSTEGPAAANTQGNNEATATIARLFRVEIDAVVTLTLRA